MTPHDHTTRVPGCYRCELGQDEAMAALVEERDELEAEVERLTAILRDVAEVAIDDPVPYSSAKLIPRGIWDAAVAASEGSQS